MAASPEERREQRAVQTREQSEQSKDEGGENEKRKGQIDYIEDGELRAEPMEVELQQEKKKRTHKKRKKVGARRNTTHNQWEDEKRRRDQGADGARHED